MKFEQIKHQITTLISHIPPLNRYGNRIKPILGLLTAPVNHILLIYEEYSHLEHLTAHSTLEKLRRNSHRCPLTQGGQPSPTKLL